MSESDEGSGEKPRAKQIVGELTKFDPTESVQIAVFALQSSGTPFALIGGLALDAWGIPRATKDADFAVPIGAAERAADELVAKEGGERRSLRIGGVAIRDEARNVRIGFIDRRFHFGPLFREAIEEARNAGRATKVRGLEVPLVSLEYLLAMKMVSGEPKDDTDTRRILRLEALDYKTARALVAQHLGVASANRLDTMARESGRPDLPVRKLYKNGEHTEDD